MAMTDEGYAALLSLLPRLGTVTTDQRLRALLAIDRVIAVEGLSWTDVANSLSGVF